MARLEGLAGVLELLLGPIKPLGCGKVGLLGLSAIPNPREG